MEFSIKNTNIAKGIAIILMLFHHCFYAPSRYEGQTIKLLFISEKLLNKLSTSAVICVSLFVFLTGYGLTLSYKNRAEDYVLSQTDVTSISVKRYVKLISGFIFVCFCLHLYSFIVIRNNMFLSRYGGGPGGILFCLIDMLGCSELFGTPTLYGTFWYISLAVILIFSLPLFLCLYKKVDTVCFLVIMGIFSAFLYGLEFKFCKIHLNLFAFSLGIVTADNNLFVKLKSFRFLKKHWIDKCFQFIWFSALLIVLAKCRTATWSTRLLPIWNGFLSFLIIFYAYKYLSNLPLVSRVLELLGFYSMNMFLVHNFVRRVWYYDFTYSFKYPILIVFVLLLVSFSISVTIEWIKKQLHYDRLITRVNETAIKMF